jgi:hypothetical protein
MRNIIKFLPVLATGLGVATSALAQDDWQINVTPYIWLALPDGDIAAIVEDSQPEVGAHFDDVRLSGAFTGAVDVRYGRFGALGDLTYFSIKADKDLTIGPLPAMSGKVEVAGTKALLVGYYRAYKTEKSSIDVMGGVHYLAADLDVDVIGANHHISRSVKDDLWDPVIGVRAKTRLTEHIGLMGLATYGGFGVSSDSLYELHGYLTYSFTPKITAELGYRYYSADWSTKRIKYDAALGGPVLGVTFGF